MDEDEDEPRPGEEDEGADEIDEEADDAGESFQSQKRAAHQARARCSTVTSTLLLAARRAEAAEEESAASGLGEEAGDSATVPRKSVASSTETRQVNSPVAESTDHVKDEDGEVEDVRGELSCAENDRNSDAVKRTS